MDRSGRRVQNTAGPAGEDLSGRMSRNTAKAFTIVILAGLVFTLSASSETRVPPDHSLTLDQYIALGMPKPEADWNADERSAARSILRKLAEQDPTQLPRFRSERSGALFEKLTQEEVFRRVGCRASR